MSQRDEILARISKASSLQEQAALVADLDNYDRMNATAAAEARSIDLTDTIVRQTLQPVAVHERSTHETDWLGDITATASQGEVEKDITVEASLWYNRLSPEVKADSEEFAEQARGMARRTASAHGDLAPGLEAHFLQYVSFLNKQAASGLPQVEQTVDSFENPAPTPLPEDVFDNFAPPIHPINQGVSGTETSERNPLLQEIMGEGNGQGQAEVPNHHDTTPQPYTYAEVPPQEPQQMTASTHESCPDHEGHSYNKSTGDCSCGSNHNRWASSNNPDGHKTSALFDAPSVAISHSMNLDQFKAMQAHEAAQAKEATGWGSGSGPTCSDCGQTEGVTRHVNAQGVNVSPSAEGARAVKSCCGAPAGWGKQAASGLPQVEQVVDSFENPAPTPLPEEVAYPWLLDGDNEEEREAKKQAFLRRAEHVALLSQKDPTSLTDDDRKEMRSFVASLGKVADQWTQAGPQYHGPDAANSPATTPEPPVGSYGQGYAEGRSDWPNEAPTYSDASSSAPEFVQGHSQGYSDAAHANPTPGAAMPGQMPPGAGGLPGYQTHTGSQKVAAAAASVIDEGILEKTAGLRVSASFTSPMEEADPEFTKGYKYATKWTPKTRLVTTGSIAFEAGLYAGISDNAEHQEAWTEAHRTAAAQFKKPEFLQRMSKHRSFTKQAASTLSGMKVVGAYLRPEEPEGVAKTAATMMDLDSMAPVTSPSPTGETPINGPGTTPPLAGGADPAAAGGPSPYNGAPPYGAPVVPAVATAHGVPTAISTIPGAPVDKAAQQHLSPQTLAFRRKVQASLLQSRQEK